MTRTRTSAALAAFVSLALGAAPLAAAPSGSRADNAVEAIHLKTQDKLDIAATYFAPRSRSGKAPAAMLVHDAGGDQRQLQDVATYLQKKGFGVLVLDIRGHGSSIADRINWAATDDRQEREAIWTFAVRDLQAGAEFLRDRREIHASNLSVVGVGAGCTLAVRHALDDENTRAVVLVAPDSESYGFDLTTGVRELEGLPTLIVVPRDAREIASALRDAAQQEEGDDFVDIAVMKSDRDGLLEDSRFRSEIASWLGRQVTPNKSKKG